MIRAFGEKPWVVPPYLNISNIEDKNMMNSFDGMGWGMAGFGGIGLLVVVLVVVAIVVLVLRRRNS